jgi:hypothetical protein
MYKYASILALAYVCGKVGEVTESRRWPWEEMTDHTLLACFIATHYGYLRNRSIP